MISFPHHIACRAVLLLLLVSGPAWSATLRLSQINPEGEVGIEECRLDNGGKMEVLKVAKGAIITEADVQSVFEDPGGNGLGFTLKPEGAAKLGVATGSMILGVDRLAVFINGKLISAPVVQARLGANFSVSGLAKEEMDMFRWQHEGKTPEEIALLSKDRMAREEMGAAGNPTGRESSRLTDEQYKALKAEREQHGWFLLDELPDAEELDRRLKKGMSLEEVERVFGKTSFRGINKQGLVTRMSYQLAAERRTNPAARPGGFDVRFEDGRVVTWRLWLPDNQEDGKTAEKPESNLRIDLPETGPGDGEIGTVGWMEQVRIASKDDESGPTVYDRDVLLGLVFSMTLVAEAGVKINANCDAMKFLGMGFPEIGKINRDENGAMPVVILRAILEPYATGEKPCPDLVE